MQGRPRASRPASAKPHGSSPSGATHEARAGTAFFKRTGIAEALAGLGFGEDPAPVRSRSRPISAIKARAGMPAHYSSPQGAGLNRATQGEAFGLCGTSYGVASAPAAVTQPQSRARSTRPQTASGARPTRPRAVGCSRSIAGTSPGYLAAELTTDALSRLSLGTAPSRPMSARVFKRPSEAATDVMQVP